MPTNDISVAVIQTTLIWEDIEANLRHFDTLLANVEDVDLVILPEMFSTSYTMRTEIVDPETSVLIIEWMASHAKSLNSMLIGSTMFTEDGQTYTNRLIAIEPNGEYYHYDKVNLFSLANEGDYYKSGEDVITIEWRGWRIRPLICYDLRFGYMSDHSGEVDVIIYVASWPTKRIAHWDLLLAARAVENISYVIGVNRIGIDGNSYDFAGHTCIHSPEGEEILELASNDTVGKYTMSYEHLATARKTYPFLQDKI